ncbi:hypothetical protein D3C79_548060 [compost metagenome]
MTRAAQAAGRIPADAQRGQQAEQGQPGAIGAEIAAEPLPEGGGQQQHPAQAEAGEQVQVEEEGPHLHVRRLMVGAGEIAGQSGAGHRDQHDKQQEAEHQKLLGPQQPIEPEGQRPLPRQQAAAQTVQPLPHQPERAEPGAERPPQQQGRQAEHQHCHRRRRMVRIRNALAEPGPQPEPAGDGQEAVDHVGAHQPGGLPLPQLPEMQPILQRHQPPAEQQQVAGPGPQRLTVDIIQCRQRPASVPQGEGDDHQPQRDPEEGIRRHQPGGCQQRQGEAPRPAGSGPPLQQGQIDQASGQGQGFDQAHASPS